MAKVRVAIAGTEFIPCLGKGPFSDIWIHEELYRILQRLGYVVTKLDQDAHLDLNVPVQPVSAPAEVLETAPVAEPAVEAQPEPAAPAEVLETAPVAEVSEQPAPVAEPAVEAQPEPIAPVAEQPVVEEIPAAEVAEEESSEEAQLVEVTLTAEEEEALKTTATKKEIQEILTAHGVKYKYNDTIEQLLAYVGLTR